MAKSDGDKRRSRVVVAIVVLVALIQVVGLSHTISVLLSRSGGFYFEEPGAPGHVWAMPLTKEAHRAVSGRALPMRLRAINGTRISDLPRGKLVINEAAKLIDLSADATNVYSFEGRGGAPFDVTLPASDARLSVLLYDSYHLLLYHLLGLVYFAFGLWVWIQTARGSCSSAVAPVLHRCAAQYEFSISRRLA